MGWEKRGGCEYYYRPLRIAGKPRRIYVGKGAAAEFHELLDRRAKSEKQKCRRAIRQAKAEIAEVDAGWADIRRWVRQLAAAQLIIAGWYCHGGSWRRMMEEPKARQRLPSPNPSQPATDLRAWLEDLLTRANAGQQGAIAELKQFLNEHPELSRRLGDLNQLAIERWSTLIAGTDALHKLAIEQSSKAWANELAGPHATPIERAIAEAAAVARLSLTHAQCQAATVGEPLAVANFKLRRQDTALHRFAAMLTTLAKVQSAGTAPVIARPRVYDPPDETAKTG